MRDKFHFNPRGDGWELKEGFLGERRCGGRSDIEHRKRMRGREKKGLFQHTRKANELEDKAYKSQELQYPMRCQQGAH